MNIYEKMLAVTEAVQGIEKKGKNTVFQKETKWDFDHNCWIWK